MDHYEERAKLFAAGDRVVCQGRELDVTAGTVVSVTTPNYGGRRVSVLLDGRDKPMDFALTDCAPFDSEWYAEYESGRQTVNNIHVRMRQMRRDMFPLLEE